MTGIRWNPFWEMQSEMHRLRSEMDRIFGRFSGSNGDGAQLMAPAQYPAVNIWEGDDQLFVEAELPGLKMEELEIYVSGGDQLTISGERKQPAEAGNWHRRERGYGRFSRLVELPLPVDFDRAEAEFKHGVLTITLPKAEQAKPRRIAVKAE